MAEIIQSQGIILGLQLHGETSALIDVFTQKSGLIKGYVKGACSKQKSGIYQKGNLIDLTHTRRLAEQLGTIQADMLRCFWQDISCYRMNFKIFNIICALKSLILPVYVYEPIIYVTFTEFIEILHNDIATIDLKRCYVNYLLVLLQQMGFSPNFKMCAVSGDRTNLKYISPKSGQTISAQVGHAYHDRLLILPEFLCDENCPATMQDIDNAQKIIQLLYNKYIFSAKSTSLNLIISPETKIFDTHNKS